MQEKYFHKDFFFFPKKPFIKMKLKKQLEIIKNNLWRNGAVCWVILSRGGETASSGRAGPFLTSAQLLLVLIW